MYRRLIYPHPSCGVLAGILPNNLPRPILTRPKVLSLPIANLPSPFPLPARVSSSQPQASPQQNNGSDCGVFTCQTLEHISRGRDLATEGGFEFTAENMPFIRRMMIWEIGRGGLMERWVLPSSSEG